MTITEATDSENTVDDNTHKKSGGLLVLGKINAILDAFTLTDPTLTLADLRGPYRPAGVHGAAPRRESGGPGVPGQE